jgi:hypothetical protein
MANPFGDTLMKGVTGMFGGAPSPTASGTKPTAPANSGIDALMGMLGQQNQQSPMTDLASILGGFSSGEKANRVVEGNFQGNYDNMMVDRENAMNNMGLRAQADRNANETDALKKLQQTSYIAGGGSNYGPMSIMLGGQQRQLPNFPGMAPMKPTGAEMSGARDLQGQMAARLQPGGSFQPEWNYTPRDVSEYAKPGLMEQIGSYGGAAVGGLGAIDKLTGGRVGKGIEGLLGSGFKKLGGLVGLGGGAAALPGAGAAPSLSSLIPGAAPGAAMLGGAGGTSALSLAPGFEAGLNAQAGFGANAAAGAGSRIGSLVGKAAPIAGAAVGTYGLMKDRGVGNNLMNGITAGASIGSMVPGLGTAVGAGIGAIVGGLRSIGKAGPSEQDLAGRRGVVAIQQQLASGANAQQQAEAQNAGWEKPQEALALIMLRDGLIAKGLPPEQAYATADQLTKQLHASVGGGPQNVAKVGTTIQQLLSGNA